MFSEKGETFKDILTKAPHFCIVAVGVNDTYTKTGANAYATIIRSRYWNDSPKLYKRYAKNERKGKLIIKTIFFFKMCCSIQKKT